MIDETSNDQAKLMHPEQHDANLKAYEKYIEHLQRVGTADSQLYDRSLLTLSSGFLVLTLTFTNNAIPLTEAKWLYALLASWVLFVLTIISVIATLMKGQQSILRQMQIGEILYLKNPVDKIKENLETESERISQRTMNLNKLNGCLFIFAVVLLTSFMIINVSTNKDAMSKESVIPQVEQTPKVEQSDSGYRSTK